MYSPPFFVGSVLTAFCESIELYVVDFFFMAAILYPRQRMLEDDLFVSTQKDTILQTKPNPFTLFSSPIYVNI